MNKLLFVFLGGGFGSVARYWVGMQALRALGSRWPYGTFTVNLVGGLLMGLLVGYLETEDFERARAGMAKREVNDRWQREMGDFFVQTDGVLPDRAMQPLEEVFHL